MRKKYKGFLASIFLFGWCWLHAQTGQKHLKIMTYNILHGQAPGLKDSLHKIDLNAVARVIKAEDPDLVALQEVDSLWPRSDNQHQTEVLAEKTGLGYFYYSDSRSFTDTAGWGYGIGILSRYPLSNTQTVFLPHHDHPGSENWVNSVATVSLPNGRELRLICAHFDYLYKDNNLLEAIATNAMTDTSTIAVVLAGDLNAQPASPSLKTLEKSFIRSCADCAFSFPSNKPRIKIDYIMHSQKSPLKVFTQKFLQNKETAFASDHLPYVVEFDWQ